MLGGSEWEGARDEHAYRRAKRSHLPPEAQAAPRRWFVQTLGGGLKLRLKETSLNVVETYSGLNKQGSLELMREIAETGVATVRGGGGGVASFLAWADGVDIREVGKDTDEPLR